MNASAWLARLLTVASALEGALSIALLVDSPRVAAILFHASLDATGVVVARIAGGALLALAIACWLARSTPNAPASRGVAWALFAYNLVACIVLAQAGAADAGGATVALAASVLHGVFGAALVLVLMRAPRR
jgi:quinol-cytochrome oxidoreductase complex cytochrome b subunit